MRLRSDAVPPSLGDALGHGLRCGCESVATRTRFWPFSTPPHHHGSTVRRTAGIPVTAHPAPWPDRLNIRYPWPPGFGPDGHPIGKLTAGARQNAAYGNVFVIWPGVTMINKPWGMRRMAPEWTGIAMRITKIGVVCAATLALSLWTDGASAQSRGRSDPRCVRELAVSALEATDPGQQRAVAQACRDTANLERGANAARARFYAGRAYGRAGDLDEAIAQLEVAVNVGRDFPQLRPEVRAAKLELAQVYRENRRLESARNTLRDMAEGDPAVAYQRALLALVERGAAGQQGAFEALRVFAQDDRSLLIALGAPSAGRSDAVSTAAMTPAVQAEIRRGRSWLYRVGLLLGQQRLQEGDSRGAINFLRPVADVVGLACPEPASIQCANAVDGTESVGTLSPSPGPSADQMLDVYFRLGIASLKSAGLQETFGLGGVGGEMGGLGALDCTGGQIQADAPGYFDAAARSFETYIRRSGRSAASAATAHWGLACTILAAQRNQQFGGDPVRLNEAIGHLNLAPQDRPLTFLTMARAYILQGQLAPARASYERALALIGANRCTQGGARAEAAWSTPSRIYMEMAQMRFAPSRVLQGNPGTATPDLYDRVIGDVSVAQSDLLRASEPDLKCAIYFNPANSEARLTLASIYLRLGGSSVLRDPIDPPPFRKAEQALEYFRERDGRNVEGAPEGYYLLSRRMTLARQFQLAPDTAPARRSAISATGVSERDAVQFAARAYNLTQRPLYKSQACQSQILFGVVGEQSLCAATGDGDDLTLSYLYEGMYWLRRGQKEGPGDRRRDSWARSIRAFNLGAERENGQSIQANDPTVEAPLRLGELLLFGQRYTLKCILKTDPGGDTDRASQEVRRFFLFAGVPATCGGPAS